MTSTPIFQRLMRLLDVPDHIDRLEYLLMTSLDTLQAAVERNGSAVASAVGALGDLRQKVAALQTAVDNGQLDQERLAALTASIDASSDAVAQALAPVVADPETPDPADVDGAVPAGEPLPA